MGVLCHPPRHHRRIPERLLERRPMMIFVLGNQTIPDKVVQYLVIRRQSLMVIHPNLLPDSIEPNVVMEG